ncbi:MAG: dipeptidase PepE [Burkholderiales bacterium]|nr:dipeptidase PepE [Burkholderiales bacterium]
MPAILVKKNLLLLSNSRMPGRGYLEHAVDAIREALGGAKQVVLIPYASVTIAWDSTAKNVRLGLQALRDDGVEITAIHHFKDPIAALAQCDAIMVNGGNTFNLLHHLRRRELIVPLRNAVLNGTPYVGWSAGSGICAPTIRTSNDMPIIDPAGLDSLGVIDFQLNAHYTNAVPEGWMGETRDQRLAEFLHVNPTMPVFGLPEGDWLRVRGGEITLHGPFPGRWFRAGQESVEVAPGSAVLPA